MKLVERINILRFFKPDIVDEKQLNIEEYDLQDIEGDNKLVGHMKKSFVRVNTKAIPGFVDEVQNNPNCSYVSCANDVIREGIVPEKISVMLKKGKGNLQRQQINNGGSSLEYRESASSKLLNFLECPVCYNFVVKSQTGVYVASVDFISENEKFYSLEDFGMDWSYAINKMLNSLNEIMDKFQFDSDEQQLVNKKEVFKDFMYTVLVREALLSDGDFHTGNMGLLYNEKEKKFKFINFDMEFVFLSPNMLMPLKPAMAKIRKQAPEVYNKFIEKTKLIYEDFDKERLRDIKDHNEYIMYHVLMDRVKAILRFDRHMILQDKIKSFFVKNKNVGQDYAK